MAARLNPRQKAQTCAAIQATLLIKRLQDDALGKIELTAGQRKSIEILLDRTVPKVAQIQHTGADGGALKTSMEVSFVGASTAS